MSTRPGKHGGKGWRFGLEEREYLESVLALGFTAGASGSMTERFEAAFAKAHGLKYAIGFNSGTGTLHAALAAGGVSLGDEVIVPALVPAMCGFAPWQAGAIPVFTDVQADTFLLDPEDVARKITDRTKAIMPVHLYGLMCNMDAIMALAREHGLLVLEDCAQCFLGTDQHGNLAGTIGHVGSWSLENSKHLSCGDGGVVATSDEQLAREIRLFGGLGFKNMTAGSGKVRIDRDLFQNPDWERHSRLSFNYRLPELCAAVGLAQTERLEHFVDLRCAAGAAYLQVIKESKTGLLVPQHIPEGFRNSYYTCAVRFTGESQGIAWKEFRARYVANGGDGIYAAWQTLNNEPAFRDTGVGYGEVPVAEALQREIMQFTTNQSSELEREHQQEALGKTLREFEAGGG